MNNNAILPSKLLVLISLVQGLILFWLHQSMELEFWPHQSPQWLFAFYTMAFTWPTMLLLSLTTHNIVATVKLTLPFALIAGLLGYYVGSQAGPIEYVRYDSLLTGFVLTLAVATFKALMYTQQYVSEKRVYYSALFKWSWRNALTLLLAMLFAGSFWLILMLCGALFEAINIDFFSDLFEQPWFYYPAVSLAHGFGIIIFRNLSHIVDTIARLQQALMKFLLIILIFISLLFLLALPFTGLDALWSNGGSLLILWMQALILFSINSVYQNDPEVRPYPVWLHRFIYFGVLLLPIYSAISFYGLSLRVEQYGWSMIRCWGFLIWFLLALFPLGYWWGIVRLRDRWVQILSPVNVTVGLVVLGAMLLANSPLLDFRKVVVASQLQRLADKPEDIEALDLYYFRYHLARPGYEALESIKVQYETSNPEIVIKIESFYGEFDGDGKTSTQEEFIRAVEFIDVSPPEDLLSAIYEYEMGNSWQLQRTNKYLLLALDLNRDNSTEYLLVKNQQHYVNYTLYYFEDDNWKAEEAISFDTYEADPEVLFESFRQQDLQVVPPKWNDFQVGEYNFQIR